MLTVHQSCTSSCQALSNLVRVRMLVEAQKQKLQRERTAEFLEAAKLGNMTRLRAVSGACTCLRACTCALAPLRFVT
jgi:hypothetical protein